MCTKTIPKDNHFIWIRYFAAFSILISHSRFMTSSEAYHSYIEFITWLFPGVPTLFFISGFLVSLSHNNANFSIEYLTKRILRIFPPLWASVILTTIALFLVGYLTPSTLNWGEFVFWFVGQLTILQVYHPSFLDDFGIGVINGSLWAIPVIFQFYIALPFFVKMDVYLSKQHSENWIYIILILFALINITFNYFHNFYESIATKVLFLTLIPWAFNFFIGYFFQRNFKSIKGRSIFTGLFWLALHIVIYILLRELGLKWGRNDINPVLLIIFAMTIVNIAFLPKSKNLLFNKTEGFLKKFDITFGIFIYHVVIINFIIHYKIFDNNLTIRLILLITATVAVSVFSMLFLEKPIRDNRSLIITSVSNYWNKLTIKSS